MKDPALASSSRLGGAVISDRVVASLLEELSNGRYAQADRLPAEVDLALCWGCAAAWTRSWSTTR